MTVISWMPLLFQSAVLARVRRALIIRNGINGNIMTHDLYCISISDKCDWVDVFVATVLLCLSLFRVCRSKQLPNPPPQHIQNWLHFQTLQLYPAFLSEWPHLRSVCKKHNFTLLWSIKKDTGCCPSPWFLHFWKQPHEFAVAFILLCESISCWKHKLKIILKYLLLNSSLNLFFYMIKTICVWFSFLY